jgi:hypothetical protein
VPPQVASVSGKPLSIAFEEIAASKATYVRIDPEELAAQAEAELAEAELAVVEAETEVVEAELSALSGLAEASSEEAASTAEPAEDEGPAAG